VPIRPTPSYATGILSLFVSLVPLGCEIVVWAWYQLLCTLYVCKYVVDGFSFQWVRVE